MKLDDIAMKPPVGGMIKRLTSVIVGSLTTVAVDPATVKLGEPVAAPLIAPESVTASRRAVCLACDGWPVDRCTVAGCSCNGMGQPGNLYSRCPRELWP